MPELTEQEKLERRRQKRQQRILASAENRLNRITGTAFPNRASPTPSPSTSASSLAPSEPQRLSPSRSTSPALLHKPSSETLRSRKQSPITPSRQRRPSDADPSEELGAPPPLDLNLFGRTPSPFVGSSNNTTAGAEANPDMPDLSQLLGGQFPFNPAFLSNMQQQQQQQQTVADTSKKYWQLLHLIAMIWLGCYAVYMEWTKVGIERFASLLWTNPNEMGHLAYADVHVPLFWYFVTVELLLQTGRMVYQKGTMASTSTLGALAAQLPSPFGNIVTVALRYRLIWSCLVQDCCILVFIIGLAELLSASLA
ncbi:uncharacterized protein BYT42DRAFT_530656 [Radiomyces spectabilis]|uniref:uncharacterized protein n=1 Tax=Radiomyces spectabilis TaxID=64574 RepID=UPI00221FBAB7|nr:uncharacterized protein BYT42DRAFT_530656 [Radiomyces spectabilis]KAI8381029.1 hypothetical protein BYT42DRAFT_530656 [Radiomyces spectabilis]